MLPLLLEKDKIGSFINCVGNILQNQAYERLEWAVLLKALAAHTQSGPGAQACLSKGANLSREAVLRRWHEVEPVKVLCSAGHTAPIGDVPEMPKLLRAAEMGHIFAGEELRMFLTLLYASRNAQEFASDHAGECPTLMNYRTQIYSLPKLMNALEHALEPDGSIKDSASKELLSIRNSLRSTRQKTEEQLRKFMGETEVSPYMQDSFFTVRNDRYVVPMSLDGRGRIQGNIIDTSKSGQTLFFEPTKVSALNQQLQDLILSEKLEVLRILRELSASVAREVDILKENYRLLIDLDVLFAEAKLAEQLNANVIELAETPVLALHAARHPQLILQGGASVVANTVATSPEQTGLIISGPNAGGKTVVLKTVGILHLMAKAGLLIPANKESKIYLFDRIHVELGDAQNLSANLSSFSGHLMGLKPIVESCDTSDLVLLDELAVGTEPQTGAAIAQAILEHIAARQATIVATTHFDALKVMAIEDERFRNGSMEFNQETLGPTYRLILDTPGQSYGIELAELIGLPRPMLDRARSLRGATAMNLDHAIDKMQRASAELIHTEQKLREQLYAAETERNNWERSREALEETRRKAAERVKSQLEAKIVAMTQEYEELVKDIRKTIKASGAETSEELQDQKRRVEDLVRQMNKEVSIEPTGAQSNGEVRSLEELQEGDRVFILPLMREGRIAQINPSHEAPVEVAAGTFKLRVKAQDVRWLPQTGQSQPQKSTKRTGSAQGNTPDFAIQTPTNTADLRGMDQEQATTAMWQFVDKSLMRGESAIFIIHGHGTDALKTAVRTSLKNDSPYDIRWRPGRSEEGGDGVTIVFLR